MIRNRFRTRFVSLLAILTTAMTALIFGATAASAQIPPDPPTSNTDVVYLPMSPTTQVVHDSDGLNWWAIVLIAAAAALVAAALTELYESMKHRRSNVTLSTA
jgi:hypothetical protein